MLLNLREGDKAWILVFLLVITFVEFMFYTEVKSCWWELNVFRWALFCGDFIVECKKYSWIVFLASVSRSRLTLTGGYQFSCWPVELKWPQFAFLDSPLFWFRPRTPLLILMWVLRPFDFRTSFSFTNHFFWRDEAESFRWFLRSGPFFPFLSGSIVS